MSSVDEAQTIKDLKTLHRSQKAPALYKRALSVFRIPEGSSQKLTTLKTVDAAKDGFTVGVLHGTWISIFDPKYPVATTVRFRKRAILNNTFRSGVAGIVLGGTFVGAMEALSYLRNGKSDPLNCFGAAFACVAPFAIYRRNPLMFLAAGTVWGSIAGAFRIASNAESTSYLFNRPDSMTQTGIYPETIVYFEMLKRDIEFKRKQREMEDDLSE